MTERSHNEWYAKKSVQPYYGPEVDSIGACIFASELAFLTAA